MKSKIFHVIFTLHLKKTEKNQDFVFSIALLVNKWKRVNISSSPTYFLIKKKIKNSVVSHKNPFLVTAWGERFHNHMCAFLCVAASES